MSYRKRVYIEEIPRVSIGKDYRAIEALIANEGGIKMIINDAKKKLIFSFRYYKDFPIPEAGVVVCSIPCNYGGIRYFYVCPFCRNRYKYLYITQGKKHPRLICRKCHRLCYRTQSENEFSRLVLKTAKLFHTYRLRNEHIEQYHRPKGIHKKTFENMQTKIRKAVNKINGYLIQRELIESGFISK